MRIRLRLARHGPSHLVSRTDLWVGAGATVGSAARLGVDRWFGPSGPGLPWATVVVNLVGCALMGLLATRVPRSSLAWMFLAVGVLGGFTTASAFGLELYDFLDDGHVGWAVLYASVSVAGGLIAMAAASRATSPGERR